MKHITLALLASVALLTTVTAANTYNVVPDWLKLPQGREQLGNQHGDVAVSSAGEVFVSVQDPLAGLQVFSPEGAFLRNVPGAPSDFHGFVIRKQADGEFIYGATLRGQTIVKMTLEGTIVMTIGSSAIPDQYKVRNARSNQLALLLTGLDVAPNGDLYVTDGYASDYIHRFDKTGKYIASFGGKQAPYSFNTLHKLAIDTRFQPARIIACDRANNRVVHLSLEGAFLGVVAKDLLLPAAIVDRRRHRHRRRTERPRDRARQGRCRRQPHRRQHGAGNRHEQDSAGAVASGIRPVAARRRAQRARRSVRLRVQRLRPRASFQSAVIYCSVGRVLILKTRLVSRVQSIRTRPTVNGLIPS